MSLSSNRRRGSTMRFIVALPLLLVATLPALAEGTPAPADAFEITVSGSAIGGEEAVRASGPEGTTLSGTVRLSFPGAGNGTLKQDARLAPDGRPLAYTLDIDAPGQQFVVKAAATDAGYTLSIIPRGASEALKTEKVAAKSPVFLVDNNFASHLDTLTRSLSDLAVGQDRAITALVPQALQGFPATVQRGADGTGTLAGNSFATRRYALTIANVREELVARASDGVLLQVAVPIQNFLITRKGFAPAATSAPAASASADPREFATEVKSSAGVLPATLLVPKAERPVPGVVFLSGSGPNDGDETIGPNKPFRDIARGLGDHGIASLRVDKRTHAIKDPAKIGDIGLKTEYYDDASVALAQLAATPGVDPGRIFLLGHSEGAMVAPKVAAANPVVRGAVLMAPGIRPIDVMIADQMAFGAKLTGRSAEEIAEQTKEIESVFAAIRDAKKADTPPFMGAPASYWREVIALDVPALVAASKIPMLVVQGDKDVQVRKDLDFDVLRAKAGTAEGRVTYRSFPGLNHLFMQVERESTGAEYGLPGHVDSAVIGVIAAWILAH